MPLTVDVELTPAERAELLSWTRASSLKAGLAQRARIVLLAGDGVGRTGVGARGGVPKPRGSAGRAGRVTGEGRGGWAGAARIAWPSAGGRGGRAGSPMPVGGKSLRTKWTSTRAGQSLMRSSG